MKLLLVLGSDETYNNIVFSIKPLGFEFIRYRYVLKAMDNIDEADPAGIIISAKDFPRHWKTLVQFVRSERPKYICPIIILKGPNFSMEDTSQALYLGVNGVVPEVLKDSEIDRLQNILSRYLAVADKRQAHRFQVEDWAHFALMISDPADNTIITGAVKDVSATGISFEPDQSALFKDLTLDLEVPGCSFRVGDSILSPVCRVRRTGKILSMEFVSFPEHEKDILDTYLENLPLLEFQATYQKQA
jgi:hypothetical protein